jgi:hypothetical protein
VGGGEAVTGGVHPVDRVFHTPYLVIMAPFRWFRQVLASFFGWFDLVSRIEHLEARFRDIELEWEGTYDKMLALHRRHSKRIQDGAIALAEEAPALQDVKLMRRARLAALRTAQRKEMG